MSKTFASLSIPNYRRYFLGLLASNIGAWMAMTAKQWLVLVSLTGGDAQALGIVTALTFLPALVFAPLSGSIADRIPKRRIMIASQVFMAGTAALLSGLVLTHVVALWHVYLLALIDGTATALAQPAQQAFVAEVVTRDRLANAISLNSACFNGARLLGPGIAGALIALVDTGPVLAINVGAFVIFIATLLSLDGTALHLAKPQRGRGQLRAGVAYIRRRPDVMLLLAIAFMMGNFGFNFAISNAVMATQAFGRGAGEYGALGSIMGIGALAAALISARRERPRIRHVIVALLAFAVFSVASALAPSYEVFAVTLIPIGMSAVMVLLTCNSLVQMSVAPEFRGRVMTVWGAVLLGGTPIISPLVGAIGNAWGARATVWFEAASIAVTVVVVLAYFRGHEHLGLRFARGERIPRLVLQRGLTEDQQGPHK